ncbi:MAG: TonB-dependent receptor [Agriterribacter sp.]
MRIVIFLMVYICVSAVSFAQVKGKITNMHGDPVASANIVVYRSADSSSVAGTSSNELGLFEIIKLPAGNYYCRITSIGYMNAFTSMFVNADSGSVTLPVIMLNEEKRQLNEVVITAKKELVKYTPTGKVFNIQASLVTKGSNALQVLERLPGVITDRRNNQFSLNGQAGVTVLFNGRKVNISMEELMALLENTVADNIEKIELITSPTAKYDADGGGGIINIIFKKGEQEGTKINLSATAGYGYREKAVGSVSLSQGFKKANIFASYSYMHDVSRAGFKGSGTSEKLLGYGDNTATFSGMFRNFQNTHNVNLSGEIGTGTKNTFGADIIFSGNGTHTLSNSDVSWDFNSGDYLQYRGLSDGRAKRHNIIASIYSRHKISAKSQLNMDASYLTYANNSPADIQANYFDREGNPVMPSDSSFTTGNRGKSISDIYAFTFSADYSVQFSKRLYAEFGVKGSVSENNNNSKVERIIHDVWETDPRSQSFIYGKERVGAAYTQFRFSLNAKSNIQAGLRYEYWRRDINIYDDPFVIAKFFPSFLYNYTFDDKGMLSFSYSRRITRPAYTDLISNLFYNDPTFVFSGNPLLKPTLTDVVKADFTKKKFNTSLSFQYDLHPVLRYQITSNATKDIGISSPQNLDYQKSINLFLNYSFSFTPWWQLSVSSTTALRNYKVSYGLQPATKTFVFQNLNFNQNIKLPWKMETELSGWYNFPFYEGTNSIRGFGVVNFALAKKLNNDWGTLQLSLPDLFQTFRVNTHIGGMTPIAFNINTHSQWRDETAFYRVVKLTYSRTFGKSSVRTASRNKQSEEADRIR